MPLSKLRPGTKELDDFAATLDVDALRATGLARDVNFFEAVGMKDSPWR